MAYTILSGVSKLSTLYTTYLYQVIHLHMQVHTPAVYVGRLGAGVLTSPYDHIGHCAYMDIEGIAGLYCGLTVNLVHAVMFLWNVLLDVSQMATTLTLCMFYLKLMLQILCESCWFMGILMVQGCEGMGDIPGVQGVQGGSVCSMLQD